MAAPDEIQLKAKRVPADHYRRRMRGLRLGE